jgi:hypothetical protein
MGLLNILSKTHTRQAINALIDHLEFITTNHEHSQNVHIDDDTEQTIEGILNSAAFEPSDLNRLKEIRNKLQIVVNQKPIDPYEKYLNLHTIDSKIKVFEKGHPIP